MRSQSKRDEKEDRGRLLCVKQAIASTDLAHHDRDGTPAALLMRTDGARKGEASGKEIPYRQGVVPGFAQREDAFFERVSNNGRKAALGTGRGNKASTRDPGRIDA